MKFTAPTALLSVQLASVLAAPVADAEAVLVARQGGEGTKIYDGIEGGRGVVTYGDGRVRYGHIVPSSILDHIRDNCAETACNPSGPLKVKTWIINAGQGKEIELDVTVQGTFNPSGSDGNKEQLLELAKSAFEEVYNAGVAEREEGVHWVANDCPAHQTVCPNREDGYADQWTSTNHVNVRVNNEDGVSLLGNMNIGIKQTEGAMGSGICEALSIASAGVGLANSAAGTAVGLLGVWCSSFT